MIPDNKKEVPEGIQGVFGFVWLCFIVYASYLVLKAMIIQVSILDSISKIIPQ